MLKFADLTNRLAAGVKFFAIYDTAASRFLQFGSGRVSVFMSAEDYLQATSEDVRDLAHRVLPNGDVKTLEDLRLLMPEGFFR